MGEQRVCYTIHNFGHQGVTGETVLWATGLCRPAHFYDFDRLRDWFNHSALNLMKGGIVYSNFSTTVSPQHALGSSVHRPGSGTGAYAPRPRVTSSAGCSTASTTMFGIRRSIRTLRSATAATGSMGSTPTSRRCVIASCSSKSYKPVIAYVGRLDRQKGVELLRHAVYLRARGGRTVRPARNEPRPRDRRRLPASQAAAQREPRLPHRA